MIGVNSTPYPPPGLVPMHCNARRSRDASDWSLHPHSKNVLRLRPYTHHHYKQKHRNPTSPPTRGRPSVWAQGLLGGGKGNELPGACQGTHDTRPTHTHRVWMVLLVKVEAATRTRDVDAVAAAFAVLVVVLLLLLQIGCGCNLARKAATGAWTAGVVLVLQGHHRIDYLHRDLAHDLGLVALQWHVPLLAVLLQGLLASVALGQA
mmetsp:Transcript_69998/g.116610  ORF Transcript_69998/g.116610 Transcript_69998/m.116610 type:complete len:206 (-) Transcript_69998:3580-4197(-)